VTPPSQEVQSRHGATSEGRRRYAEPSPVRQDPTGEEGHEDRPTTEGRGYGRLSEDRQAQVATFDIPGVSVRECQRPTKLHQLHRQKRLPTLPALRRPQTRFHPNPHRKKKHACSTSSRGLSSFGERHCLRAPTVGIRHGRSTLSRSYCRALDRGKTAFLRSLFGVAIADTKSPSRRKYSAYSTWRSVCTSAYQKGEVRQRRQTPRHKRHEFHTESARNRRYAAAGPCTTTATATVIAWRKTSEHRPLAGVTGTYERREEA
jgi:hypothetical protein